MLKTTSAKKALRQNIRRRAVNLARREKIKKVIKEYQKFLAAGEKDRAKALLPKVYKILDKMAKVNLIKRGRADRIKSRLAKKLAIR